MCNLVRPITAGPQFQLQHSAYKHRTFFPILTEPLDPTGSTDSSSAQAPASSAAEPTVDHVLVAVSSAWVDANKASTQRPRLPASPAAGRSAPGQSSAPALQPDGTAPSGKPAAAARAMRPGAQDSSAVFSSSPSDVFDLPTASGDIPMIATGWKVSPDVKHTLY